MCPAQRTSRTDDATLSHNSPIFVDTALSATRAPRYLADMQHPPALDRLSTREYVSYALGDTASNLFFQTFNIFLTYYYVDVWGIPAAALLLMMPLVRLWDAINDPLMGVIADRTNTRWGKFRPYLLWGAIPYGVCGYLMFAAPHLSESGKLVYAYITYTLMLMAYTVINVPYSSLLGVISPSSRTRTVASSFRFVGAFGATTLRLGDALPGRGGVRPRSPLLGAARPQPRAGSR